MDLIDYLLQELKVGRLAKDDALNFLTQCRDRIDTERPQDSRLHPLLERNTSQLSEQRFSTHFSGAEFFLSDHRVAGERVLPAAAYVEMARAGLERSLGTEIEPGAGWEFEELVWVAPLRVSDEGREVHLGLEAGEQGPWVEFEIYSGAGEVHARGRLRAQPSASAAPLDVPALLEQSRSDFSVEECYAAFAGQGIEYGAAHRVLREVRLSSSASERWVLARFALPESVRAGAAPYQIHPSVLDGALQAVLGLRFGEAAEAPLVPFAMRRVRLYAPTPASGYVQLSATAGASYALRLCDESGAVCVEIEGLTLLPFKPEASPGAAAGSLPERSLPEQRVSAVRVGAAAEELTGEERERTVGYLKRLLSAALKLPAERIEADVGLEKYGIDSVLALQLLSELERVFGELPKTLLFEYRSIDELAGYLCAEHAAALEGLLRLKGRTAVAARAAGRALEPLSAKTLRTRKRRSIERSAQSALHSEPIAIVGLSGRYPQAPDLERFWHNLAQGRDCISEIPQERWDHTRYFDPSKGVAGKSYSKWGGFIEGVDEFDALFFGISPAEAQLMDPQERLFLQCVYHTLEDAGYTREALNRSCSSSAQLGGRVGVFVGVMYEEYQLYGAQSQLCGTGYALSGNASSIANRVSYFCNFNGPSMAVDTMCSSSLTAIHLACQSLKSGECEVAVAGGVNVSVHPNKYLALSQGRFASSTGRCESFGEGGDGYVPGEGVGAVLLKPLSRARADADHIYGLIRGTSINHGGKTNGYTVPNPQAQGEVIERALREAGVDARTLSYIEAHGTGTALGDPIEIKGLTQAFERYTQERGFCAIGSAKSNIGHLESAAGIAGLTKVLLQMQRGQLVPSLHSEVLNPHIDFAATPFRVQQQLQEWSRPRIERAGQSVECARLAGVSSFGAGGSNAHLIVEEYLPAEGVRGSAAQLSGPALMVLSARNEERLRAQVRSLLEHLRTACYGAHELFDVAYTLQVGREAMESRLAFTAESFAECAHKLEGFLQAGAAGIEGLYVGESKRNRDTVALFSADEQLQQAIDGWVSRGKYEKLLELWVKGLTFDWHKLHEGSARARLSLPSYPFARERHWVEVRAGAVGGVSRLHPLLERNTSQLSEQRFSTHFSGAEFFLSDHRVAGERVLPAAAYVEMARAGLERSLGTEIEPGAGWEFEELVWVAPLRVSDEGREVHLGLEAGEQGPWVEFEIYSGAGEVHARGRLRAQPSASAAPLDVPALLEQSRSDFSVEECYAAFAGQGIEYGAAHRVLREVRLSSSASERWVLARFALPESVRAGAAPYQIHPSVLDGALQAVLGLRFGEAAEAPLVPFAMRRVRLYAPTPASGYVQLSATAGASYALRLCDESGAVCVEIEGLTLLPFKPEASPGAASSAWGAAPLASEPQHRLLLLSGQWQGQEAVPAAPSAAERRVLLSRSYESSLERLRELAPHVQFGLLSDPGQAGESLSAAVHGAAEELLEQLGAILKGKPRTELLLQVVLCAVPNGPEVGSALGAMLRSASQENPKLKGQLLLLDSHSDAQSLWESLERNGASGEAELRERAGVREVFCYELFSERQVAQARRAPWKDGGVYLISGGAGGLGLIVAEQIVRTVSSARVILSGRSPLSEARLAHLERLRALDEGCVLEYQQLDVSDRAAVQECVRAIEQRHGTLSGVLHGAGLIRDSFIINKSAAQLHEVLAPKIEGLMHLDEATQSIGLDCFIVFSSVAGALGNVGQVDYALGNAFMDRYAHYRNELVSRGLRSGRTLSVNWPLWAQGGMSVTEAHYEAMRRQGIEALSSAAGVVALQEAWSSAHTQVLVLGGEHEQLKELLRRSLHRQLRETRQLRAASPGAAAGSLPERSLPEQRVSAARVGAAPGEGGAEAGLPERVQRALVQAISRQLKVRVEEIDAEAELSEFGFDSISFTQLGNELNERYGLTLSPTVFFEHSSVQRLASYLCTEHGAQLQARLGAGRSGSASAARAAAEGLQVRPVRARRKGRIFTGATAAKSEPIAIIGMSGCFPGAADVHEFWRNLEAGTESIEQIPASRWDWRAIYGQEANQTPIKWGGFIEGVDEFDALFFGISPAEAQLMDPQQRLLLQHSWKALEDAGYAARTLSGTNTGVFLGTGSGGYGEVLAQAQRPIEGHSSTGVVYSVGPNRLSYLLDLHGPSEPVETACSSSLVAIHRAVRAIRSGDCAMALVGGVNTILTPWGHISFNKAGMLSEDGRCKVFSQAANGYVRGEGVGILLLKGLSAAERDGDHIYALIRGSAENHGGRANSLTAPNPQAQAQVIKAAIEDAQIDARTLSYIEAHGTGTALGDPIEIQGLKSAFAQLGVGPGVAEAQCGIGSVKSNVGHLEIAAGVAGLIKVLLQLKHRRLVKSLHAEPLNPYIELRESPFYIVQEAKPWAALTDESGRELPRRAGISSFGFGGVNAHLIVEEYLPAEGVRGSAAQLSGPALMVLSARNEERLRAQVRSLLEHLRTACYGAHELFDVAYTLQVGREAMESRLAFTAESFAECAHKLEGFLQAGAAGIEGLYVGESKRNRDTVALFSADEQLQQAIDGWVSRGKYEKLLELWVKGLTFDWHKLHEGSARARLSLPSYPFARERHWVEVRAGAVGGVSRLHPLLERNTSQLSEQRFSTHFSGAEFFLSDHRVAGERVLPAAAYVEMARAGLERSLGTEIEPGAGWEFEELVWVAPLRVSDEGREVHLGLEAGEQGPWVEFEIYSGAGEVHARGRLRAQPSASAAPLDVPALLEQSRSDFSVEECYAAFAGQGIEYGAAHRVLREVRLSSSASERWVLARFALPESVRAGAAPYQIHPSVLDGALQAVLGLRFGEAAEAPLVPFAMRRVRLYAPTPASGYVQLSATAGASYALRLCDESGAVCVEIEGLTLLPFKPEASPGAAAGSLPERSLPEQRVSAVRVGAAAEELTGEERERTVGYLKRLLSAALKLPAERIEADVGLEKYGIDSVLALQLLSELERVFGELPKTLLFEYRSIDELAGYLCAEHAAALEGLLRLKGRTAVAARAAGRALEPLSAKTLRTRKRRSIERSAQSALHSEPIAIVGLSGRYPQAPDLERFWHNLAQGRDCISEIPQERWDHTRYFDPSKGVAGKSYSKWGGFIEGVDEFDALFFGISPAEAQLMDPQERLFLQCVYHTLEDAGYTREALNRSCSSSAQLGGRVGVFVGVMYEEYQLYGAQSQLCGTGYALSGNASSIANRVSYFCNFNGPSMAVDTMCSSSLTAIHLACQSLKSGECEVAVAGGVNVSVHPNKYLALSQGRFASSTGRCESFGEGGDGYVPGEGVGAVLLKPLSRARADADHIYGLIRGTSINHGGKTNGYTVPNPQAQGEVIERALREAGVDARTLSYIEAHGTGTALGDPIEIKGLTQAFERYTQERGFCAIGSAKSNIGHLESAAGIAGLTKVLLQMQRGQLVPSLHSEVLNPHIDFAATPFRVQQQLQEWSRPRIERAGQSVECARLAGVSSFGAGGSNAHLIVEEYLPAEGVRGSAAQLSGPALMVLSARNEERLRAQVRSLLEHLRTACYGAHELFDVAYTLQVGREAMESRLAFTAESFAECAHKLEGFLQAGAAGIEGLYVGESKRNRDTVALFSADEQLQQAIDGWVSRGKYEKLLELWVKGLTFDWHKLHEGSARARLSLPSYPFARERHWVPAAKPSEPQTMIAPTHAEAPEEAASSPAARKHDASVKRLLDDLLSDAVDLETATTLLDSMLTEDV